MRKGPNSSQRKRAAVINAWIQFRRARIKLGFTAEELLVMMVIRQAQIENQAVDVTDISERIGAPRTTVLRALVTLRKQELIRTVKSGRRALQIMPSSIETSPLNPFYDEIERIIKDAASLLMWVGLTCPFWTVFPVAIF